MKTITCVVDKKAIELILDYVHENIPSVKHIDTYRVKYNELNDLIVEFTEDKIAVLYCDLIQHSIVSKCMFDKNYLDFDDIFFMYNKKHWRSICITNYNFNTIDKKVLRRYEFAKKPEDLIDFEDNGDKFYILDTQYFNFDHFKFKDSFEIVDVYEGELIGWNFKRHYPSEYIIKEETDLNPNEICEECTIKKLCELNYMVYKLGHHVVLRLKK